MLAVTAVLAPGCAQRSQPSPVTTLDVPTRSQPVLGAAAVDVSGAARPQSTSAASGGDGNGNGDGNGDGEGQVDGDGVILRALPQENTERLDAGSATGAAVPGTWETRSAPAAVSTNRSVVTLVNAANDYERAGRYADAAAVLERGLEMEPGNAWLWHRLARARLYENKPDQSIPLAEKSNSLAGADRDLQQRNRALTAEAEAKLGTL